MTSSNDVSYSDIPLSFKAHPVSGDIGRLTDESAVRQAIKLLVLTNRYERVGHPEMGGNLIAHLFDLGSPSNALLLRANIETCLQNSELRAIVHAVDVIPDFDHNSYDVSITFQTQQMLVPDSLSITLERVR